MEGEGIILLTFLMEKVNNNNNTIRERIKDLIFKICSNEGIYPIKASFKLLMNGVQSKNAKIKKECLEIVGNLVDDLQEELFTAKDVKIIVKEVDSHDKNTRSSALETCVEIYKLVGDKFWTYTGKNLNQKVKDLLQSKISTVPKTQVKKERKTMTKEKPPKPTMEHKGKTLKPPMQKKGLLPPKPIQESKIVSSFKPQKPEIKEKYVMKSHITPASSETLMQNKNKSLKKFVRRDSSNSKPSQISSPTVQVSAFVDTAPIEEAKVGDMKVKEALLTAKTVDELVDLDNLDTTGEIIEKILYGSVEEKVDALVLFNDIVTSDLDRSTPSLVKNAEFLARTFSDVLDGIFYRYKDGGFPSVFVKYMIQVFKK